MVVILFWVGVYNGTNFAPGPKCKHKMKKEERAVPHTKPCIVLPMMSPSLGLSGAKKAHRNVSDSSENKREREIGAGFNYYPHSRRIAVLKLAPHTTSGICPLVLYAATLTHDTVLLCDPFPCAHRNLSLPENQ